MLVRPTRPGGKAFAWSTISWGLNSLLQNAHGMVQDPIVKLVMVKAALLASVGATIALVLFALAFSAGRHHVAMASLLPSTAIIALAIIVFDEGFVDIVAVSGRLNADFTLASSLFIFAPFFISFYVALVVLSRRLHDRVGDAHRTEATIATAALGGYLSFVSGFYLTFYGHRLTEGASASDIILLITFVMGTAALFVTGWRLRGRSVWILPATTLLILVGMSSAAAPILGGSTILLHGLFRLLAAALIAYGILKHQLFGIDLKVKWGISRGLVAFAFAAVFFVVDQAAQILVSDRFGTIAGIVAALALLPVLAPMRKLSQRVADKLMPGVAETEAYLNYRKFTIYRAAAETAARNGQISGDERSMLDSLRAQLGLGASDAAAVEREVLARPAA